MAAFGESCRGNDDCQSGLCVLTGEAFCTRECPDDCACPTGMFCRRVGDGSVCALGENLCDGVEDAGVPEEDAAAPLEDAGAPEPDAGPEGGGAGAPCTSSDDCADVTSRGGVEAQPEIMTVAQECWTERESGFPDGLCSMADCEQNYRRDPCPAGTGCIVTNRGGVCLPICDDEECRPGWTCRDDVDAGGPNHAALCWFSCARTGCADGLECQDDGTCQEPPPGPLDGCTDWDDGWSCVDRSPTLCSCTCYAWPRGGSAPSVSCELVAGGEVACSCTTGGEPGERDTATLDLDAAGADCAQAESVFEQSFCGLVP